MSGSAKGYGSNWIATDSLTPRGPTSSKSSTEKAKRISVPGAKSGSRSHAGRPSLLISTAKAARSALSRFRRQIPKNVAGDGTSVWKSFSVTTTGK